ncbi:hypothetical protein Brsp05_04340 [Brucella sp. NBRC 12953]
MQAFLVDCLTRRGNKRLHVTRCIKGRCRFEHNAELPTISIKSDTIVAQGFVGTAMTFDFNAMSQKRLVELEDMVFGETQVIKGLKHKVHGLGLARDLLLVHAK